MDIKILGTGCVNCQNLETVTRAALAELGLDATIDKVTDPGEIVVVGCDVDAGARHRRRGRALRTRAEPRSGAAAASPHALTDADDANPLRPATAAMRSWLTCGRRSPCLPSPMRSPRWDACSTRCSCRSGSPRRRRGWSERPRAGDLLPWRRGQPRRWVHRPRRRPRGRTGLADQRGPLLGVHSRPVAAPVRRRRRPRDAARRPRATLPITLA